MKNSQNFLLIVALILIFSCRADASKKIVPNMAFKPESASKHFIKVALLLDTSNSMDGLIDQAKAQLWEIVNELSYAKCKNERPNLQIALYEYGNDNLKATEGYVRKILAFTDDLDDVSKELFSLTTNGGSEYCGTVIQSSLNKLDWGNDADDLKMIFIAGNEPFTQGKIHYRDAVANAKEKGVIVNTIFCGNHQQGIATKWQEGALLAYGDYMVIDHNIETVHINSPYDDIIIKLNVQLNDTYIPYGQTGKKKIAMQYEQDSNAAQYSKANAVSRAVTKGSHLYKNSTWDLVDAAKEQDFRYNDLKKDNLPEELKEKSKLELKAFVDKQSIERTRIQAEIAKYNKERREFISQAKSKTSNGLESAIIEAIKKQALKKDYSWN